MVGICDANNFYISCERVFNPALNGRPAVVLSNNDRCIIARSNEAKAIGLKMGQPIYQVRDTLRTYNVALCSPNFPLYQDMSDRMQAILKRFAPTIVYSIDEAFLDFRGFDPGNWTRSATRSAGRYGTRPGCRSASGSHRPKRWRRSHRSCARSIQN